MAHRRLARLQNFLDDTGRLRQWPARTGLKSAAIQYLAAKIDAGVRYTESEINALLDRWHTFGDAALLRRLLFEGRYLDRTRDGRAYWVTDFGLVARGL